MQGAEKLVETDTYKVLYTWFGINGPHENEANYRA